MMLRAGFAWWKKIYTDASGRSFMSFPKKKLLCMGQKDLSLKVQVRLPPITPYITPIAEHILR